jgi:hypothetical protein
VPPLEECWAIGLVRQLGGAELPEDAVSEVARLLARGGPLVVPAGVQEWCVPQGLVGPDARPVGPLMRPDTLRALATEAGYGGSSVVGIEHPFWRFYRLVP